MYSRGVTHIVDSQAKLDPRLPGSQRGPCSPQRQEPGLWAFPHVPIPDPFLWGKKLQQRPFEKGAEPGEQVASPTCRKAVPTGSAGKEGQAGGSGSEQLVQLPGGVAQGAPVGLPKGGRGLSGNCSPPAGCCSVLSSKPGKAALTDVTNTELSVISAGPHSTAGPHVLCGLEAKALPCRPLTTPPDGFIPQGFSFCLEFGDRADQSPSGSVWGNCVGEKILAYPKSKHLVASYTSSPQIVFQGPPLVSQERSEHKIENG